MFCELNCDVKDLNKILKTIIDLKNTNIHKILLNKENNVVTSFNNRPYVLMNMAKFSREKITLKEINEFKNQFLNNYEIELDWKSLWSNKLDYFEYQIEELKNKLPYLYMVSDYYIGLAEIGINIMNNNFIRNSSVEHKRIKTTMEINELYNPLNLIIDDETRDYAEYYKELIFKGKPVEIINYVKKNNIINIKSFFIRLLYITPFYDNVDKIIKNDSNDESIKKIVKNNYIYEKEIKKLYSILLSKNLINEIEFLK